MKQGFVVMKLKRLQLLIEASYLPRILHEGLIPETLENVSVLQDVYSFKDRLLMMSHANH